MSAEERLIALALATGARRAAIFRSRAGLLGVDPPLAAGPVPGTGEELMGDLAGAVPVTGATMPQLAQALQQALAAPRRRPGARGNVLRVPLGRSAELLLVRGEPQAAAGLEAALDGLENEALAWDPPAELRAACSFVGLDDRTALLLGRSGELLAMSPSMRRALGADVSSGSFLAPARCREFLAQVQELASGGGHRDEARGLGAPGEIRIERLHDLTLVLLSGAIDLQARLLALASADMTPREIACGVELSAGKSYREIAAGLHLSPDTVKLHLRAVYQKLGVSGREAFVALLAGIGAPRRARA